MTRLGLRLALAGGRGAVLGIGLASLAVAMGTAVLLFALSFPSALTDRGYRDAWRTPTSPLMAPDGPEATAGVLVRVVGDRFEGRSLLRVMVAPLDSPVPVPPGIRGLPGPGEAYVSPALAALLDGLPADQLGDRLGRVVGTIGDAALRSPQELVAITGMEPAALRAAGGYVATAFPAEPRDHELPPVAVLLVTLAVAGALAPVGVFVATATRLSAARREQRLAALRLVGATPAQTARLALVEATLVTTIGALGGICLFFAARPLVALIPLDDATWFPDAIRPPIVQTILLIAAVPVFGAGVALLSLRRIAISPLGVQRRTTPPAPGVGRLIPLAVATSMLLGSLAFFRGDLAQSPAAIVVVGGSFAGIIGGIAWAGPWLTFVVGRLLGRAPRGGAATLLAARRLADDPRGSFGSIAGVVMAVFVATTFLTFAGAAEVAAGGSVEPELRPGEVVADAPIPAELLPRLEAIRGVTAVVPVQVVQVGAGPVPLWTWVVPCARLTAVVDVPGLLCGRAPMQVAADTAPPPPGTYAIVGQDTDPTGDGGIAAAHLTIRPGDVIAAGVGGWKAASGLPDLIIEPSALPAAVRLFPVTRVFVETDGTPAAVERVRTALEAALPGAFVRVATELLSRSPLFDELGRVIILGLLGTMILAGCSLAVAVTTAILDRRRQFALLRSAGMPASSLRSLVLLQAGAPLIVVAAFSALLGVAFVQAILRLAEVAVVPLPNLAVLGVLLASVGLAIAVVALVLPPIERLTRPDTLRTE